MPEPDVSAQKSIRTIDEFHQRRPGGGMMYGQAVYDRQKRDEIIAKIDEMMNNINEFIDSDPEYATAVRSALKARAETQTAQAAALYQYMESLRSRAPGNYAPTSTGYLSAEIFGTIWP